MLYDTHSEYIVKTFMSLSVWFYNSDNILIFLFSLEGCDSNSEAKCSNFKSSYNWNNYVVLNNMY